MVRIRVLGALEAENDSGVVDLGGPRQRAVLALLLVARGDVVPVDRLIDDLWHGEPPPRAVGALQAYISNLRRALEPDRPPRSPPTVLVSRAPGYAIALPSSSVDAWQFEDLVRSATIASNPRAALEQALNLWRGSAYAEVADEGWALAETARLDELRHLARERLIASMLASGEATNAVPDAQALTREHPLREEGWRLLALSLHASGRQAEALAALRTARAGIADELGLDPGAALSELESQILGGTVPSASTGSLTESTSTGSPPVPATLPLAADLGSRFVGRTEELAALHETAVSPSKSTRVALLSGEAGSGKSSLLHHFRRDLIESGWRVAIGRCPEVEGAPPAWAWVEVLRTLAADVDPGELTASLAPLLDENGTREHHSDAAVGRFLLHRAVAGYLTEVGAGRPLAIFLDDAHRADDETLSLVTRLVEHQLPALIVMAMRPDEIANRLDNTLADLARLQPTRLRLGGLDAEQSAEVVRQCSGRNPDARTLAALAERTGGNPFYLRESARLLESEGELVALSDVPEGVRDVLRRRLARLPEITVSVLRLAAVVGRESDIELLVHAAEVDENTVLDALESGVIAGLLEEPGSGMVRFTHALVRDTLYSDLTLLRRSRWHGRVAGAMETLRPSDHAALALHFTEALSAATARKSVDHNAAAAAQAVGRYAHDSAVGFFESALSAVDRLPSTSPVTADERVTLLAGLSRSQLAAGASHDATDSRRRALAAAQEAGRTDLVLHTLTVWDTPAPWMNRRYGEVDVDLVGLIEKLLTDSTLDPRVRTRLLVALVAEIGGEDYARALSAAHEAELLARESGDPVLLGLALTALHSGTGAAVSSIGGRDLGTELIELATSDDLAVFAMHGHSFRAERAAARADLAAARHHMSRQSELADRYQWRRAQTTCEMGRGLLALLDGELEAAEEHYRRAHALMVRAGLDADETLVLSMFTLRITQGRVGELETILATINSPARDVIADPLALALVANGDRVAARRARKAIRPVRRDFFRSLLMSVRGLAVAALGERAEAQEVFDVLSEYSGELGGADTAAFAVGPVDTILGDLAALLGHHDDAIRHYRLGLKVAERCGCLPWIEAARSRVSTPPSLLQADR